MSSQCNYPAQAPTYGSTLDPIYYDQAVQLPHRYPEPAQRWMPTREHPYPMNFVQAPSPKHQVLVTYNGQPYLQGLHTTRGPQMFPYPNVQCNECPANGWERKHSVYPRSSSAIAYPTTHSIPGPFLQSYISLPKRVYGY